MVALRALAVLLFVWWPTLAIAANAELRLDVESISVGQAIQLSVIVSNGKPRGLPTLEAPDGIRLNFNGQTSTNSIINGQIDSSVTFRYEVAAQREGVFVIGPAKVQVTDRKGRTFEVRTGRAQLDVSAGAQNGTDAAVEVSTAFDRSTAWQGEVVVYNYNLRSRREIRGGRWFGHPTEGLLTPRDGQPERRKYDVQDPVGVVSVEEVSQPMVATKIGRQNWDPPALELDLVAKGQARRGVFRMFQRTERFVISGEPLSLEVKPLPEAPEDFSGLVGEFKLLSKVDRQQVSVGDSVPWKLEIIGDGSLEGYSLPEVPEIEGLQVYEGEARAHATMRKGRYRAVSQFVHTVVATREGPAVLPSISLVVFSPSRGEYVTLRSEEARLYVRAGEAGELDLQSFAQDPSALVATIEDQPRPVWTRGRDTRLPWLEGLPLALLGVAAPALVLAGLVIGDGVRTRLEARRQAEVPREATPRERLQSLPEDPDARMAELDAILRLALANKAEVAVSRLDRESVLTTLPDELQDRIRTLTASMDRARFAGDPLADPTSEITAIIDALEVS